MHAHTWPLAGMNSGTLGRTHRLRASQRRDGCAHPPQPLKFSAKLSTCQYTRFSKSQNLLLSLLCTILQVLVSLSFDMRYVWALPSAGHASNSGGGIDWCTAKSREARLRSCRQGHSRLQKISRHHIRTISQLVRTLSGGNAEDSEPQLLWLTPGAHPRKRQQPVPLKACLAGTNRAGKDSAREPS